MVNQIEGELLARDNKFAIVVSRFNDLVTKQLCAGAIDTLKRHGAADENISVVWVPGAFEIGLTADTLARSGQYQAVICLGAVIAGQTTHNEYINHQVARSIMQSGLDHRLPVSFGLLTCQTLEQAMERAGGKAGNKGIEAALAAIEMVNVLPKLSGTPTE